MACKLVPSSIAMEGIINITVIVGHIITISTAAILQEMTGPVETQPVAAIAAEGVVERSGSICFGSISKTCTVAVSQ